MTTTTKSQTTGTLFTTKAEARVNRDKDTGWGYAFAHLIPFVAIYYACSRRTITPWAYSLIGNLMLGIVIGLSFGDAIETKKGEMNLKLLGYLTTPFLVKAGISSARSDKKFGLPKAD